MIPKRPALSEESREVKIPKHDISTTLEPLEEGEIDPSVEMHLEERREKNRMTGTIRGTKICIDNLGWAFDKTQLIAELKQYLSGVKTVTIASTTIRGMPLHFGYGCIEFDTLEAAVYGMIKLDTLYLDCPGSPIPRPILSHFPQWSTNVWGDGDIPGYLFHNRASPHFCQPNTIERQVALEWRHLQKALKTAKKRLCDIFMKGIVQIIHKHRSANEQDISHAFHGDDYQLPRTSVLVYKGVSIELKDEKVRDLMETSDQCIITRTQCPVSGSPKGCVFVDISDETKAASLAEDMSMHLFCLGRGPRPADVDIVRFGPPAGFEGVFDRAIEYAFNVKMEYLKNSLFSNSHIVDSSTWRNEKRECCEKIRGLMESMVPVRFAWKMESNASSVDLHERQAEWVRSELRKLEKLEKVFSEMNEKENKWF